MMRGEKAKPAGLSSADLLRSCGRRLDDAALWREFEGRFQRRIFLYLLRACRLSSGDDRGIADLLPDLAQDVYVRLVRNEGRALRSFRGDTDFAAFAFLASIATRVVCDHFRHDAAMKRTAHIIPFEDARDARVGRTPEDVLPMVDLERTLARDRSRKHSARDALIFKLHYVEGCTAREIAAFPGFGLTVRGVEAVLTQWRRKVKET